MFVYPFRKISRALVVAACAVSFGVASLSAQSLPAGSPSGADPSRFDLFLGYSYFGAHGQVKPAGLNFSAVNVGTTVSGAYFFNKYVGLEVSGFENAGQGDGVHGQNDGFEAGYAGPIFRAPMSNFTLFAHAMAGGVYAAGPNSDVPATYEHEGYTWGPSVLVGGGMDYSLPFLNHRFGLRLFQADYRYIHEDYGPPTAIPTPGTLGGRANLNVAELSTGLLVHFGSIVPPAPVQYGCTVTAPTGTIYPGDIVTVTGTAMGLSPKKNATYSWTSEGGTVTGSSNVASIDTKGLAAGQYSVKGHIAEGKKPGEMADCSVPFTVTAFAPPTVGCAANPSTVKPGDPSTITANGVSPQNRPLTYSYSASAGAISGNTSTATLTTTGVPPGTITVTCNVVDDKGQTASQQTTVTVEAPAAPPAPTVTSLCTISFDRDKRRPTRVDNEAKACLDDIALNAQRQADAKLDITGSSAPVKEGHGKHEKDLTMKYAAERAVNEKAYLVNEKGIDASRISVYTGTAGTDTAATTLVPAGATFPTDGLTPVDETAVKAIPRTAVKKHKK
jgi:hypothetical protein